MSNACLAIAVTTGIKGVWMLGDAEPIRGPDRPPFPLNAGTSEGVQR